MTPARLRPLVLAFALSCGALPLPSFAMPRSETDAPARTVLRERAVRVLQEIVRTESNWIQIHAAETLVAAGDADWVVQRLAPLADADLPHRIGIWRVLAAGSPHTAEWKSRIEAVVRDPRAADRKQAVESVGKLRHPVSARTAAILEELEDDPTPSNTILPAWALHWTGDRDAVSRIRRALTSPDPLARQRAGYALRWIGANDAATRRALVAAVGAEPRETLPHAFLLSAAFLLEAGPGQAPAWKRELEHILFSAPVAARFEAAQALAGKLGAKDLPLLSTLLDNPEHDTRVAGAGLILEILAREEKASITSK